MNLKKKIFISLGVLVSAIALVVAGFLVYLKLHSADISKIDDSMLNPSSQILSDEDNSYYEIKLASEKLVLSEDNQKAIHNLSQNTEWDDVLAQQIVESNAVALTLFNKGSWKKGYQDPVVQTDPKTWNTEMISSDRSKIRSIAELSLIKSWILFKQGKEREAFDNTLNAVYFGQALENSPRTDLLNFLIGMSIKGPGMKSLQSMIPQSHLTSDELKDYLKKMDTFKDNRAGLQEAFRMNYITDNRTKEAMIDPQVTGKDGKFSAELLRAAHGGMPLFNKNLMRSGFYYKPNQTQKLYVEQYQDFVNNAARQCGEVVPRAKRANAGIVNFIFTENVIGKTLTDSIEFSFNGIFDTRCQEEFSVVQTQIMMAVQAYKKDNGMYLTSLDLLSPNYMNPIENQYGGRAVFYDAVAGTVSLSQ